MEGLGSTGMACGYLEQNSEVWRTSLGLVGAKLFCVFVKKGLVLGSEAIWGIFLT